tara:strand:+ start:26960 stop:28099 length:1140 start_codon:yes stop_codon:yes gene_type:complete
MNLEHTALMEVSTIESLKYFQRLSEKTQVLVPQTGREEVAKNRLTHSYEVVTSAYLMASNMAQQLDCSISDIDYNNVLKQICLLHDLGHPPFGHDGAKYIDKVFKSRGLEEGFSDNNNNLVILDNHGVDLRDEVKAGIIKYPNKLYPEQKEKYVPILEKCKRNDRSHFSKLGIMLKDQEQTVACQIMDEADRNSYTCSDLTDFFCLGHNIEISELENQIDLSDPQQLLLAKKMIEAVNSGSKTYIKEFFRGLKNQFNANWTLTEKGLTVIDENLFKFRESLSKVEFEHFIKPIRKEEFHQNNMHTLKVFINNILDENFGESSLYTDIINNTKNKQTKLKAMRDMIGEVSDWYVINYGLKIQDQMSQEQKTKTQKKLKCI